MTEQIDATNTTEHMADAESTAESAKAAVRGVEETHPEYVDFAVDDFPGGLPACLEAILMVADQPQYCGIGPQHSRRGIASPAR